MRKLISIVVIFYISAHLIYAQQQNNASENMLFVADSLLHKAKKENNIKEIINQTKNKGIAFVYNGNHFEALLLFDSLKIWIEDNKYLIDSNLYYKELATVISFIGATYEETGENDIAMQNYLKSLEMCELHGLDEEMARNFNNIGKYYFNKNNYENAKIYFEKSLEINTLTNNKYFMFDNYNNLGSLLSVQQKNDSAIVYFEKALQIAEELDDNISISTIYINLSRLHHQINQPEKAKQYLLSSIQINEKNKFLPNLVDCYFSFSQILLSEKKIGEAMIYAKKALYLSDSLGLMSFLSRSTLQISKCFESNNQIDSALYYYKIYTSYKDSLFDMENARTVKEMETRYSLRQKQTEIDLLKQDNEHTHRENRLFFIISIVLLLLLIFILGALQLKMKLLQQNKIMYSKNEELKELEIAQKENKIKLLSAQKIQQETESKLLSGQIEQEKLLRIIEEEKHTKEIELKNRELSTAVLHIGNKNLILSEIKHQLEEIKQKDSSIVSIVRIINENIALDEDWKQFKLHFESVHPKFFEKLKEDYGELSTSDLKLCAYLKLNLTSKEIAQMLHITIEGVNKRRQRLRKKLALPMNGNLADFMMSY